MISNIIYNLTLGRTHKRQLKLIKEVFSVYPSKPIGDDMVLNGNKYTWKEGLLIQPNEKGVFEIVEIEKVYNDTVCLAEYADGHRSYHIIEAIQNQCVLVEKTKNISIEDLFKQNLNYKQNNNMKNQDEKQKYEGIAMMLADPTVTLQHMKDYHAKAEQFIKTVEMAQEAEARQLKRTIGNIVSGRIG